MATNEIDVTAVTQETYNHIAPRYAQKIKAMTSDTWVGGYEKSLLDKLVSLIRRNDNGKVIILDIGCGNGKDTYYVSQKGRVIAIGLDYSSGMLLEARKIFPDATFLQADMRSLSFSDGCFHGLWANGCIYHIRKKDLEGLLSEVRRVLHSGGIFSFNFKLGEGERLEQNPRSYGGKPRFYAYYGIDEMTIYLEQARFEVLDIEHYP